MTKKAVKRVGRPTKDRPSSLLKALRQKDLTQVWLAKKLGVSVQVVNYWTLKHVSLKQVFRVAKLLSVPVRTLRPDLPK
jgi:DNA-binding transcriptional regulator YiaG